MDENTTLFKELFNKIDLLKLNLDELEKEIIHQSSLKDFYQDFDEIHDIIDSMKEPWNAAGMRRRPPRIAPKVRGVIGAARTGEGCGFRADENLFCE